MDHGPRTRRSARRGVLLLVVLSLLVLFMLIGTAFLMSSNQYRGAAKEAAKFNRVGSPPTKLLDRAIMQIVRDTDNTQSAIRYHSLLRDLYGTDGFVAVAYSPAAGVAFDSTDPAKQVTRFAGATAGTTTQQLGPTQGQLIELYVRQLGFSPILAFPWPDDPLTPTVTESSILFAPDARQVLALEPDPTGQPKIYPLPLTKGYFNGCLLTITSGPAKGQSARILDYDFVNTIPPNGLTLPTRLFRFRVMAFPRTDGSPLQIDQSASRAPELIDLAGATIVVNGRPFNGTGVGYNPFAAAGTPKLSAVEAIGIAGQTPTTAIYPEIALTPNSTYFFPSDMVPSSVSATDFYGARYKDPTGNYLPLNPKFPAAATAAQRIALLAAWKYPNFTGQGDADESYDAADFQNMYLALQTVTPRSQGRVVISPAPGTTVDIGSYFKSPTGFLRLDLEDLPLPSFYRPDLENYWFHWLLNSPWLTSAISTVNDRAKAILQPINADGSLPSWVPSQQIAGQIIALKRKISLRPLAEDNPHFDGSNPNARVLSATYPSTITTTVGTPPLLQLTTPYWEAVGPWDVDNDNDGVPDSVWVDLGDPVTQAEDGTLYKPLYAFLVMDMDSRLNVNAHGLMSELAWSKKGAATTQTPPGFDDTLGNPGNLARTNPATPASSNFLPRGIGYGPADISLRPALSPTLPTQFPNNVGDPGIFNTVNADDFSRIIVGRYGSNIWGRNGSVDIWNSGLNLTGAARTASYVQPGMFFDNSSLPNATATANPLTTLTKFGYPFALSDYYGNLLAPPVTPTPCSFATPPDLLGRYGTAVDFTGQPVFEAKGDLIITGKDRFLLYNSPYDLNLADPIRRDEPNVGMMGDMIAKMKSGTAVNDNDDAPYATADLERVLRAHDADTGALPDRLWNVVDAFDPVKLVQNQPDVTLAAAKTLFNDTGLNFSNTSQMLAAAQQMASISRRLVTTDSYDLPVPSQNMPSWVLDAGPDNNTKDDFQTITGHPRAQATLLDLLRYRVFLDQRQQYITLQNLTVPLTAGQVTTMLNKILPNVTAIFNGDATHRALPQQILAPEVIAGQKMDLNRPFGDGEDNNNNGVVDEPDEAGEPFIDKNGNGVYDAGEKYLDVNGNGQYDAPVDRLWKTLTAGAGYPADYTNGVDPSGNNGFFDTNGNGVWDAGEPVIHNNGYLARQLFARQLYCLMMLTMDPNYAGAPLDRNDPQVQLWISAVKKATTGATQAQAELVVRQKMMCQTIAQWAINVVDARDPDAIMTPFEYDEDPWDGWNCTEYSAAGVIKRQMPLDGDVATNENEGTTRAIVAPGDWQITPTPTAFPANFQTRGVVWGAERPELLITESMAFHDRRTEDTGDDLTLQAIKDPIKPGEQRKDTTLDQRLKPRGSLFLELYNPWSPDAQKPLELFSKLDSTTATAIPSPGVELGRLSNYGIEDLGGGSFTLSTKQSGKTPGGTTVTRSPVWRVIVIEEPYGYRNNDALDQPTASLKISPPTPTEYTSAKYFTPTDPDNERFKPTITSKVTGYAVTTLPGGGIATTEVITRPGLPYVERSFYFTTDNSTRQANKLDENYLRVKDPTEKLRLPANNGMQYFLAPNRFDPALKDVPIAPIMPGRYGIVGSAGAQYIGHQTMLVDGSEKALFKANPPDPTDPLKVNAIRFVTTVSRPFINIQGQKVSSTLDSQVLAHLNDCRRIELLPSPNPYLQQVLVGGNGGDPMYANGTPPTPPYFPPNRENEVIKTTGGGYRNVYAAGPNAKGEYTPNDDMIQPCVAIPVYDMNVSEPTDAYSAIAKELDKEENQRQLLDNTLRYRSHYWNPIAANGEGAYVDKPGGNVNSPFDQPFDTAPALLRNGTTRNYRTVCLQRLANPLLPWNPPPSPAGTPAAEKNDYKPGLPINDYRTIDTSSVDLTVFNGASSAEPDLATIDPQIVQKEIKMLPNRPTGKSFDDMFGPPRAGTLPPTGTQRISFRSFERGYFPTSAEKNAPQIVPRGIWRVQPANVTNTELLVWRPTVLPTNQFDDRVRSRDILMTDLNRDFGPTLPPTLSKLNPIESHFDFVMEHTLGFANRAFGQIWTGDNTNVPASAAGTPTEDKQVAKAPAPIKFISTDSTYPWFAWNDRPFVSAEELLQVPARSTSQMLRQYTAINPLEPIPAATSPSHNPYANDGQDGYITATATELFRGSFPFGHLLDFFASTADRRDTTNALKTGLIGPSFNRILDFVQVPSRFVGTDELLNPDVFTSSAVSAANPAGPIASPTDPRYSLQPPFNKVSRERDPGRVNINTVVGRRIAPVGTNPAQIWSEVYDGIMHRYHDADLHDSSGKLLEYGHFGPAWRDVELSRKGYVQIDAAGKTVEKPTPTAFPDCFAFGLNSNFPSFFSNPFRSASADDLVPLQSMIHFDPSLKIVEGVQATLLRSHPYAPGDPANPLLTDRWGKDGVDDDGNGLTDDAREAGFDNDMLAASAKSTIPLFSEAANVPAVDPNRNPYMMYQPMTRLGNLVTEHSNVFAVWVTVGYFEVEKAPDWSTLSVRQRFGGTANDTDPATIAARALYDRVYPEGYALAQEVGSDTGNTKRQRGFYIIDRTIPVGFKPGEDLNDDRAIKVRRRIE